MRQARAENKKIIYYGRQGGAVQLGTQTRLCISVRIGKSVEQDSALGRRHATRRNAIARFQIE